MLARALPGAVSWGRRDIELNAAFYTLKGVLDHMVPHAHGGGSGADNLVTACQPCNYGKGNWFIEQVGLRDPRLRTPVVDGWDGLARVLGKREAAPIAAKGVRARGSVAAWLAAVDDGTRKLAEGMLGELSAMEDLGVSWAARAYLIVRMTKGATQISVLGIAPDGTVEVPWDIGPHKDAFRPFVEVIAGGIAGAECYETAKMWRVRRAGRPIGLGDLMAARGVLRSAFEGVWGALG